MLLQENQPPVISRVFAPGLQAVMELAEELCRSDTGDMDYEWLEQYRQLQGDHDSVAMVNTIARTMGASPAPGVQYTTVPGVSVQQFMQQLLGNVFSREEVSALVRHLAHWYQLQIMAMFGRMYAETVHRVAQRDEMVLRLRRRLRQYEPVADPAALGVRSETLISFYTMLDEHVVPENANGPVRPAAPQT